MYVDHVFTTIIWMKSVKKRPSLPREQLVASCFAATNPSIELWGKYTREINRLSERGDITKDDYAVLAYSLEARRTLMDQTQGDENAIIEGTVADVLEEAKRRIREDEDAALQQQLDEKEKRLQEAVQQRLVLMRSIETYKDRINKMIYSTTYACLIGACLILFIIATGISLIPDIMPQIAATWWKRLVLPSVVGLAIWGLFSNWFGISLKSVSKSAARYVSDRAASRLISGLPT
jgi:hypothetical protein